jgi:predicted AAA+ superfamily ATPase
LIIKRYFYKEIQKRIEQAHLPFIQVLLGPRQVGKSTTIAQIGEQWVDSKIIESADRLSPPGPDWVNFLWQRAREKDGPCLLAIDEIQKVQKWSEQIKILFDQDRQKNQLRIILSGSASLSLQRGLSESLAGRYEVIRCPHWGLDESRQAFGWDLETYLKYGGYPSAATLIHDKERWQSFIRDGIIEPVIGRDLQSMVTIQKPALLRQLFELAMLYPAQEVSYQKLLGQLQDHGNVATIKHYLEILAGGFLLTTLDKFSKSGVRRKASSPKILPLAPALIHAFTDPEKIDSDPEWRGHVFECAIGAHLHRLNTGFYYWRENDDEVDFILEHGTEIIAIEVKSGRRKRGKGLLAFKALYGHAKTLTMDIEMGRSWLDGEASLTRLRGFL